MKSIRYCAVVMCLTAGGFAGGLAGSFGCSTAPRRSTTFDRHSPVQYTQRVSIPDEAVIYMQNLALMRSRVTLGAARHLELALPPRIIAESLQLRVGPRQIRAFNIQRARTDKLGTFTRVRIRDIQRYAQAGQPLVVEYLTWGVYWSAQYRVDVLPEGQLRLQLGAMIQNHWYDLSSLKVTLVAGWVGVTPVTARRDRGAAPSPARLATKLVPLRRAVLAWRGRGGFRTAVQAPSSSRPAYQSRSYRTRAFAKELVSKYHIRRVDKTQRKKASNFQLQFSEYYAQIQGARPSSRAFYNRVDGYALYRGLKVNLSHGHKSYLRMASLIVNSRPYYLWPADRGESVYTVYKVPNRSKILLPAGTAWIYRGGVFVGHDVHHWTPVGGETFLTTTNDGGVVVKKTVTRLHDETVRTELAVRSLANRPVDVDIFERNPLYSQKGTLSTNIAPVTAKQKGRYHRFKIRVKAKGSAVVRMEFTPAPRPAPAPAPPVRPASRNSRRPVRRPRLRR